jgi:hypothetical protein
MMAAATEVVKVKVTLVEKVKLIAQGLAARETPLLQVPALGTKELYP